MSFTPGTRAKVDGRAVYAAIPPIWNEAVWPLDWMALRLSPVYYGIGVPRGGGSPVVLVPGFLGSDLYLGELYFWLQRVGHRPFMSRIGINAECPGALSSRLLKTVRLASLETGQPVSIVGHSLGGIIGRRVALQRPDLVSQLVYLGSPLQAVSVHPGVVAVATILHTALSLLTSSNTDCLTTRCPCGFINDIGKPLDAGIEHAAIYSRSDGVVDWRVARELNPRLNYEVGGTHIGLVYNARAYRVLGRLLTGRHDV